MKSNRPIPHIKKDITGNPYIDRMGVWVCSFNGACARGDSPPQAYAKCMDEVETRYTLMQLIFGKN